MIKITAIRTEEGTEKLKALIEEYKIAKRVANETINSVQPLIDAVGAEKLRLVKEQLEIIKSELAEIDFLTGNENGIIASNKLYGLDRDYASINYISVYKDRVVIHGKYSTSYDFYQCSKDTNNSYLFGKYGLVTNWNKWEVFENLQKKCEEVVNSAITTLENKARAKEEYYQQLLNN